jgi:hypothetical protein
MVNFYQTSRSNNSEDSLLRTHRRENLKSHIFVRKFEGKRLLERPKRRWKDDTEIVSFKEIVCAAADWIRSVFCMAQWPAPGNTTPKIHTP